MINLIKKLSRFIDIIGSFLKLLSFKEKFVFAVSLILLVLGLSWLFLNIYQERTGVIPVQGGILKEGVLGTIQNINPILSKVSAEKRINKLIYSSLVSVGNNRNIENDLALDYKISNDGLIYTFNLKNAFWSDGEKLTSDDIIFTFNAILSPNLESPLKNLFEGIRIEKVDEDTLEFHLFQPYSGFLFNLTRLLIIPEHVWSSIPFDSWPLVEEATIPITAGPYQIEKMLKDKNRIVAYELKRNDSYHLKKTYIDRITVKIFDSPNSLRTALLTKQIDATADLPPEIVKSIDKNSLKIDKYSQPIYFAIFFNLQRATGEKKLRVLIDELINKKELAEKTLAGLTEPLLEGPFSDTIIGDLKYATSSTTTSIQTTTTPALTEPIKINLSVPDNYSLKIAADAISKQLAKYNFQISLKVLNEQEIRTALNSKDFDALLFGGNFSLSFDIFDLWHYNTPGNLVAYQNSTLDQAIEEVRSNPSPEKLSEDIFKIKTILKQDAPAIFLFSPYLTYIHDRKLKIEKIDPLNVESDYLNTVNNWYFNTKRIWK